MGMLRQTNGPSSGNNRQLARYPMHLFPSMVERSGSDLPLSSAALHILLALAGEDLHGYGIMQEIARQSGGIYKLGPGTLYDNLRKLIQDGWVQELGPRQGDNDPRRRYYRLSDAGRDVLRAETVRLTQVVREARLRLRIPNPRRV
jgi:DNA-binding PadR family transcriptional regulator